MSRIGARRSAWRGVAAVLFCCLALACASRPDRFEGVGRVVVVGDVHGDYERFEAVLVMAGLVDDELRWAGGETHLVQLGDVPDRGSDSRKVMDLLMRLEPAARMAGGRVHALIGNHEAMNMYGDLRYVDPGEYEAFVDVRSKANLERLYEAHVADLARAESGQTQTVDEAYREAWFDRHPLGYVEHRLAFAPDGRYGRWIRSHDAILRIDDTLFMHAGLGPPYVAAEPTVLNERVRTELRNGASGEGSLLEDEDGPLWYRGLALGDEAALAEHVTELLAALGAERIVVGHTPVRDAPTTRFDGRVVLADVGLSAAYGGRVACVVIEGGSVHVLDADGQRPLASKTGRVRPQRLAAH